MPMTDISVCVIVPQISGKRNRETNIGENVIGLKTANGLDNDEVECLINVRKQVMPSK